VPAAAATSPGRLAVAEEAAALPLDEVPLLDAAALEPVDA
jgi:hypothetical protein